jgi:hypothetical protein
MVENINAMVNHLMALTWMFAIVGVVHLVWRKRRRFLEIVKSKKPLAVLPELKPLWYMVIGLVLILCAYGVVSATIGAVAGGLGGSFNPNPTNKDILWSLQSMANGASLTAVVGLMIAGMVLMASVGSRWLVNLAKVLVTLSILLVVFFTFIAYV